MFGMSYRRFRVRPEPAKLRRLIERAAQTGVAVEVNAAYHPDPLQMIRWCQECDANITFGSDAHDIANIGRISRIVDALYAE